MLGIRCRSNFRREFISFTGISNPSNRSSKNVYIRQIISLGAFIYLIPHSPGIKDPRYPAATSTLIHPPKSPITIQNLINQHVHSRITSCTCLSACPSHACSRQPCGTFSFSHLPRRRLNGFCRDSPTQPHATLVLLTAVNR
jgi:hypothetical protein